MRWLGRASATQMYCALLFSANMVVHADPAADVYEVRLGAWKQGEIGGGD